MGEALKKSDPKEIARYADLYAVELDRIIKEDRTLRYASFLTRLSLYFPKEEVGLIEPTLNFLSKKIKTLELLAIHGKKDSQAALIATIAHHSKRIIGKVAVLQEIVNKAILDPDYKIALDLMKKPTPYIKDLEKKLTSLNPAIRTTAKKELLEHLDREVMIYRFSKLKGSGKSLFEEMTTSLEEMVAAKLKETEELDDPEL